MQTPKFFVSPERISKIKTSGVKNGLWLEISCEDGKPIDSATKQQLLDAVPVVPRQLQTIDARVQRRFRLSRKKDGATDADLLSQPTDLLVLRKNEDVWLFDGQGSQLVLSGFFSQPGNQLEVVLNGDTWRLEGYEADTGTQTGSTHLLHWSGLAQNWPDTSSMALHDEGSFYTTQFQTPAPAVEGAASSTAGATATSAVTGATVGGISGAMGLAALGVVTVALDDKSGSQSTAITTSAPTNTITAVSFSADTGASSSDFVTNTAAQTISGSLSTNLATGDSVWLSIDNGSTWAQATATVGTSTWSLTRTLVGSNTLQVKVTDLAGNDGTIYSQAYVLDTIAPNTPTLEADTSLLAKARAATKGKWFWREEHHPVHMRTLAPGILVLDNMSGAGGPWGDEIDRANAAFIARATKGD
jgi:hypothetical protein